MRSWLIVVVAIVASFGVAQENARQANDSVGIEEIRRLYGENSFQVAVDEADKLSTESLSADVRRELTYLRSLSQLHLGRHGEARDGFAELIKENDADVWAGRAHWRLQPGLPPQNYRLGFLDRSTTDRLAHLRRADELLSSLSPDDLEDFYTSIVYEGLNSLRPQTKEDREYLFSFIDRLIEVLTDEEKIAQANLIKAQNHAYVTQEQDIIGYLRSLRQIVTEFPKTDAAARAQLLVAQHYIAINDLVAAVYELSILTNSFGKTDVAKEGTELLYRIKQAEVQFALPGPVLPDDMVSFTLIARNTGNVRISAVSFDPVATMQEQKRTRFDLKAISGRDIILRTVSIKTRHDFQPTSATVQFKAPRPGAYVLKAEASGAAVYQLLVVSNLALVANQGNLGHEFWVVDAKSGKPRGAAEVIVGSDVQTQTAWFGRENLPYFSKWDTLKVDTNGFADFQRSNQAHSELFAIARDGDHFAFVDNLYWQHYGNRRERQPMAYFYTDRSVYRPDQKVYWRAMVRDRVDGEYSFEAGEKYSVEIMDPRGTQLQFYDDLALSKFGTLADELDVPEGAPLGMYQCIVRRLKDSSHIGQGNFRVEEYKKPEYEVQVSAETPLARVNEQVEARISANYYFGAPVADAEVKYTVRRRPRYQILWDYWGWRPDAGPDLGWFDKDPQPRGPMHGSGGDIVAEGTGRTDSDGMFKLKFEAKVPPKPEQAVGEYTRGRMAIWPPYQPWRSFDFQVEATVIDKSRRNIDGSDTIVVSEKALQLRVRTERQLLSPGDVALASLTSMNMNDKPIATTGTLYVERLKWNPTAKEDDITTISTTEIEIGSSGTLISRWRIPEGETGRMRHLLVVEDPFGGVNTATADFYVAAPETKDVHAQYQGVEIVADKTHYEVGDTARLMILNEYTDSFAWYWIDSGSGNLAKRVIPLPHRTNFITIPITGAFVPNSKVNIVAVRNQRIIMDEVELIVPPLRQVLNVEVIPSKAQYLPGEEGTVEIRATDYAGKPVEAEFSLSMFDQSVLYIAPDMRPDVRRSFFGQRRPMHNQLMFSNTVPRNYRVSVPEQTWYNLNYDWSLGEWDSGGRPQAYFADGEISGRAAMKMQLSETRAPAAPAPMSGALASVASDSIHAREVSAGEVYRVKNGHGEMAAELVQPRMRTDFRDSMFWTPAVVTDANGRASVNVTFPDSLTTWKCVAVGLTPDTKVGNVTTDTIVTKNLLARLEAPRFFRERDQVTLTGVIHNYLDNDKQVEVQLTTGAELRLVDEEQQVGATQSITVEAGGEKRIDWKFDVLSAGETSLTLVARTDEESDAVEKSFPVLPHGIDKFVAWNGSSSDKSTSHAVVEVNGGETLIRQTIQIPNERIKATSVVDISVNPSLAFAIRDALPYMIEYPYGCVEQTMSRFMPAVVAMRTFQDLGIPAPSHIDDKLPEAVKSGLQRLADMQLPDGSWGWWKGDQANLQMTAYVMYGLSLCRDADVQVDENLYNRGLTRLAAMVKVEAENLVKERRQTYWYNHRLHSMAYGAFVLSQEKRLDGAVLDTLWEHRVELTPTGLALLARTLHRADRTEDVQVVLRNLHNFVTRTPENGAAHWGRPNRGWYWWEDGVESTAMALMAHLEADPQNSLVDESMKWLVLNRKGRQWKSTKDTAHAVLALSSYLRIRNETAVDLEIDISLQRADTTAPLVGTSPTKTVRFSKADFWSFDGNLRLRGDQIPESPTGEYQVSLRKRGGATMFYTISAEYFTLEEDIAKAGNEIYVERTYERLVREAGQSAPTGFLTATIGDDSVVAHDTYVPLKQGEEIKSGDELRVTLKIKSLNDYEYLVFEDPKPAGTEPVDLQSGTRYGGGLCSNMELRDQHVAFFMTRLSQGEHEISYNVRAEIPGTFHTMPTKGYAMYFPLLRTNSDELILRVVDR